MKITRNKLRHIILETIKQYALPEIQHSEKNFPIYKTYIHRNVKLGEAPSFGKPILLYNASSTGSHNYTSLVSEILNQNG